MDCWCIVCDFEVARSSQLACTRLSLSVSAANLQPIFVAVTVLVASLQGDLAEPKVVADDLQTLSSSFSGADLARSDCARDRLCVSVLGVSIPYVCISINA